MAGPEVTFSEIGPWRARPLQRTAMRLSDKLRSGMRRQPDASRMVASPDALSCVDQAYRPHVGGDVQGTLEMEETESKVSIQSVPALCLILVTGALASELELWHAEADNAVSLGVVISGRNLTTNRLHSLAESYLRKYKRKRFIQVFLSTSQSCLSPEPRSPHASKPLLEQVLRRRGECLGRVAELMSLNGNAALRIAENGEQAESILLRGRDPYYLRFPAKNVRIVLVAPFAASLLRIPLDKRKVFLRVSEELMNVKAMKAVFREVSSQLPPGSLTVVFRTDDFFWPDLLFPLSFPFISSPLTGIGAYNQRQNAFCLIDLTGALTCRIPEDVSNNRQFR